eukprot:3772309-Prymnesium_polylepis.1
MPPVPVPRAVACACACACEPVSAVATHTTKIALLQRTDASGLVFHALGTKSETFALPGTTCAFRA